MKKLSFRLETIRHALLLWLCLTPIRTHSAVQESSTRCEDQGLVESLFGVRTAGPNLPSEIRDGLNRLDPVTKKDIIDRRRRANLTSGLPRWIAILGISESHDEKTAGTSPLESTAAITNNSMDYESDLEGRLSCLFSRFEVHPLGWSLEDLLSEGPTHLHCVPSVVIRNMPAVQIAIERKVKISSFASLRKMSDLQLKSIGKVALRRHSHYLDEIKAILPARMILEGDGHLAFQRDWNFLQRSANALAKTHFHALKSGMLGGNKETMLSVSLVPAWLLEQHFHQVLFLISESRYLDLSSTELRFSRAHYASFLSMFIKMFPWDWLDVLIRSNNQHLKHFIVGLSCDHLTSLSHVHAIALTELYNEQRQDELFPDPLRSCLAQKVAAYAVDKKSMLCKKMRPDYSCQLPQLGILSPVEVRKIGGHILSEMADPAIMASIEQGARLIILAEIAGLQYRDLLTASISYDQMRQISDMYWQELGNISRNTTENLGKMQKLLYFSTEAKNALPHKARAISMSFPPCLNNHDFMEWSHKFNESGSIQNAQSLNSTIFFLDLRLLRKLKKSELMRFLSLIISTLVSRFTEDRSKYSFMEHCTNWLNLHGQNSSLLRSKTKELARGIAMQIVLLAESGQSHEKGTRSKRSSKVSWANNDESLESLYETVRSNWRQVYRDNLLTSEQKLRARQTFETYFSLSVDRQRAAMALSGDILDEEVERILERRVLDGSLSHEQEMELHKISNELKVDFIQDIQDILGINITGNPESANETFAVFAQNLAAKQAVKDFRSIEHFLDPEEVDEQVVSATESMAITHNIMTKEGDKTKGFGDANVEKKKGEDYQAQKYPTNLVYRLQPKRNEENSDAEILAGSVITGPEISPWKFFSKRTTIHNLTIFDHFTFLENYSILSTLKPRASLRGIWPHLKRHLTLGHLGALQILALKPLLSELTGQDLLNLVSPIALLRDDWGHEALFEISHRYEIDSAAIDSNASFQAFLRPVLNCSLFTSVNHWKLGVLSASPGLCRIFSLDEMRQTVSSMSCPDLDEDVFTMLAISGSSDKCSPNLELFS